MAKAAAPRKDGQRASKDASGPQPTLRILETRVLRGPNIWFRGPAIVMLVDLGELEEWPSNRIPHFNEALLQLIPSLDDHACSLGRRGGFVTRLKDGTWLGHVSEHIALELQSLAGTEAHIGKTRSAGATGQYNVVYEYREEEVGREAGRIAVGAGQLPGQPRGGAVRLRRGARGADPARRAQRVRAVDPGARRRGRLARHPVDPARPAQPRPARPGRPPAAHPGDDDVAHVGDRRRHRLRQEPDQHAAQLGRHARATLAGRSLGRRAPSTRPRSSATRSWSSRSTATTGAAWRSTCATRQAVRGAYTLAREESRGGDVVVETFVHGNDYRVLVVGGKLAAVAERVPASVVGDGKLTVRALVDKENIDPRRGIGHERVLTRIRITAGAEELVRKQGLGLDDVPKKGQRVHARRDRQHVDRRHGHRSDARGASRQRRDRRDSRPGRRPGHRRHRLHRARHHRAGSRAGRRDRRGQRRARLPDAHQPDRGRGAVRRQAGARPALPAGLERANPDRLR